MNPIRYAIEFRPPRTEFEIGQSLVIHVQCSNPTEVPIIIDEPKSLRYLGCYVRQEGGFVREESFGAVVAVDDNDIQRLLFLSGPSIEIGPGASHTFTEDVGQRWPHLFLPGDVVIWFRDDEDGGRKTSNTLALRVVITERSIDCLFEVVSRPPPTLNPKAVSTEDGVQMRIRGYAAHLIGKFYPALKIDSNYWDPIREPEYRASIRRANEWWERYRWTPTVQRRLAELNFTRSIDGSPPSSDGP